MYKAKEGQHHDQVYLETLIEGTQGRMLQMSQHREDEI